MRSTAVSVNVWRMCQQRAVLVVTRSVQGTATNVARRRVELACALPDGHEGEHHDPRYDERWKGHSAQQQTILRHEEEPES